MENGRKQRFDLRKERPAGLSIRAKSGSHASKRQGSSNGSRPERCILRVTSTSRPFTPRAAGLQPHGGDGDDDGDDDELKSRTALSLAARFILDTSRPPAVLRLHGALVDNARGVGAPGQGRTSAAAMTCAEAKRRAGSSGVSLRSWSSSFAYESRLPLVHVL